MSCPQLGAQPSTAHLGLQGGQECAVGIGVEGHVRLQASRNRGHRRGNLLSLGLDPFLLLVACILRIPIRFRAVCESHPTGSGQACSSASVLPRKRASVADDLASSWAPPGSRSGTVLPKKETVKVPVAEDGCPYGGVKAVRELEDG